MYCKYCGHKIDDDATYCAGCGVKLNIAVAPERSKPQPSFGVSSSVALKKTAKPTEGIFDSIEEYEPTFHNMLSQFSPLGKVAFILLNLLVLSTTAALTLFTFYPNAVDLFK